MSVAGWPHEYTLPDKYASYSHGAGQHLCTDSFQSEARLIHGYHFGHIIVAEGFRLVGRAGALGMTQDSLAGDSELLGEHLDWRSDDVLVD